MCRLSFRHLIFPSASLLLAYWAYPAFGEDPAGQSTWKIVASPESSESAGTSYDSPSVWDEPLRRDPFPSARPTAVVPAAPIVQSPPSQPAPSAKVQSAPQRPRPLIPSRQIDAANRGEFLNTSYSAEQVRAAIGYNSNAAASQSVAQLPRRTSSVPAAQPSRRGAKPFQNVAQDPTITPWLNLYRPEELTELPNYFAYVRPQMQQLETNRRAQTDILYLQREVQNVSTAPVGQKYGATALPPTGHSARFMDTAQYYGRWER